MGESPTTLRKRGWRTSQIGIAVAVLVTLAACGDAKPAGLVGPPGGGGPPVAVPVASVLIDPPTAVVRTGSTTPLTVIVRDAAGRGLSGRAVVWRTSSPAIVMVSDAGLVTGIAPGAAMVTAESEGRSAQASITVEGASDYAIVAAQFTQGVQDADGAIPLIRDGLPAALNVLLRSATTNAPSMQVVLRLFDANGTLVHSDTARTASALSSAPQYSQPSAQMLLPASLIRAGMRWEVVRDPRGLVRDSTPGDDRFPASGTAPLVSIDVAPMNIRVVPIVLAQHLDASPAITPADLPAYLQTFRSSAPLGRINSTIGTPLVTSASFGVAPRGGESAFWLQVLAELESARAAHPTESHYNWYGVVAPPPGFNFTSYGGFSYISSNAPGGRVALTSLGVRTGWFTRPSQARDLVAHELGHSFGRQHTPCGGADPPLDAFYPVPGGTLDHAGHDVYSWSSGFAFSAVPVPSGIGDVMGYCFPAWSSAYTYRGILAFRQRLVVTAAREADAGAVTEAVEIRGTLARGSGVLQGRPASERATIQSSLVVRRRVASEDRTPMLAVQSATAYLAEGLDGDGRVLFTERFEPVEIDHAPHVRHFSVVVARTALRTRALVALRILAPSGASQRIPLRIDGRLP